MRKRNKAGGITIPDIKLYYKATVIKTAWYWHKNRHIDQWNRTESPELNPSLYGQLIFNKGGRSIKWSKNSLFNKWFGRSKISYIPCSNIFTDMSPRARDIKERINKWDLIIIKSFCMAIEKSIKIQRERTVWEKIFANDTSDKGLISKIYKELTRLHSRKRNNPIKNGQRI